MRFNIRVGLLTAMALIACVCAAAAVGSVLERAPAKTLAAYEYQWSVDAAEAEFILREYGGVVGVFEPGRRSKPMSVTDIEVFSLREADRAMLETGIAVRDRAELMELLEDLGS